MIQQALLDAAARATKTATDKGLAEAQVMSQGPESLGALALADHPYARRHGFPMRDPAVINEQTGAFLRDWKTDPVETDQNTVHGAIVNENPVADYLTQPYGAPKSKMFARPIDAFVEDKTEGFLITALQHELEAFENTDFYI